MMKKKRTTAEARAIALKALRRFNEETVSEYLTLLDELALPLPEAEKDPRVVALCERATRIMDQIDRLEGMGPA